MHTTARYPISVKGIVFESDQVWLRRNEREEWELPGGKLDPGEQPVETVVRELREELGFDTLPIDIISASMYTPGAQTDESNGVLVLCYLCKLLKKVGAFEEIGEAGPAQFEKFRLIDLHDLAMPNFYKDAIGAAWGR